MRMTIIGCGTAVPDPERVASGYLLETDDVRILLDCGPGVVHGLARARADWAGIDVLALTHFHNDHIGDIPALFFAWKYGTRPRRSRPLTLIGPPGTAALVAGLPEALGAHVRDPGFAVRIREVVGGETLSFGTTKLRVRRTRHAQASVAWRVEAEGHSVGYTGDTGPDDPLADFMYGVDVLICDCSVPDDEPMSGHLTPASAAAFAGRAQPGLFVPTHAYPQLDRDTLAARIGDHWPGQIRPAFDGMVVDL